MAISPLRFFSPPPFEFLAEHLAKDKDFLADANALLGIEDATYVALADALATDSSFLNRESLRGVVERILGPEGHAAEVSGFIWRLHRILRHESDEPLDRSVTLLREAITKSSSKQLSKDDRNKLADRIERLAVKPAALGRQYKAEQLVEATGTELEDLQVICDIRPVFNEARSEIEGAVPISTLKLDVASPDGSSSRVEVRLTESQIADLYAKAESAKNKLLVIKKMLAEKSVALPSTSATVNEGKTT